MRAQEFIVEYTRQQTTQTWGQKLAAAAKKDPTIPAEFRQPGQDAQLIDMVLAQLETADPTTNKQYTQGLAKLYANGGLTMEDATSTLADYLVKFHRLNQKKMLPQGRNDFLKYQHVGDFMSVMDEYPNPDAEQKTDKDKGQAQEVYNGPDVRVITPKDETAACYYGQGTRWCTAANKANKFNSYNQQGPLYIVIPKKPVYAGEKYQFHFPSDSFMNEKDESIGIKDISKLVQRMPALTNIFQPMANQYNLGGLFSPNYAKDLAEVTADVAEQLQILVKKNQDKIIKKSLQGVDDLGPETQQALVAAMPKYFSQALDSMKAPDGFWTQIPNYTSLSPGRVQAILTQDQALQQAAFDSKAAAILYKARKLTKAQRDITGGLKVPMYRIDNIMRPDFINFVGKQVPALYTKALQKRGHAV